MTSRTRVYVGGFTVDDATVLVDLYIGTTLMGDHLGVMASVVHKGDVESIQGYLPHDLYQEDLRPAAVAAAAFAVNQAGFLGHVGTVNYVHRGLFDGECLADVVKAVNVRNSAAIASFSDGAPIH